MLKRNLILPLLLMALSQWVSAADVVLTVESDKPVYSVGEKAYFTGRLRNVSQNTYIESGNVEYIFSVSQDGVEIWRHSWLECG